MDSQLSPPHTLIQTVKDSAEEYSLFILLAILIFSILSTRTITGLQSQTYANSADGEPRRVRKLPYWIPGIGHAFSYVWRHRDFLLDAQKTMNEPVVALQMGLQTQHLVYSPDMIREIIKSNIAHPGAYFPRVMEYFVGDSGATRRLSPEARKAIDATLTPLTQESTLTKITSALVKVLERETADFVSFNRSLIDQMIWERNSGIVVEENSPQSCESLLDFHPDIVEDLLSWDQEYVRLIAGAPRWIPSPGISAAYAARDRVQKTISVLQASFSALEDGRNAPLEFRDLDDVSDLVQGRMRCWRTLGTSASLSARLDAWFLWKMTADASKLVCWNILHIFSDPELLSAVRKEIEPYVKVSRSDPKVTGLPIAEPPRLSINTDKLFSECLVLKSTYAETIRMDANPISYRQLTSNLTLTESEEDAAIFGRKDEKHRRSYQFFKNDILGLASGAHHFDPRYYRDTKRFVPFRFLSRAATAPNEKPAATTFDWQTVLPFAGDETCSALIEREVMLLTASIISLWDVEAVDRTKGLQMPGHRLSTNAFLPSSDVKVRLRRHE